MKKATFYFVILIAVFFSSCEDVVKVDLNTATPKLVIEANINWEKGTPGNIQRIKLSTTTSYYDTEIPKVSGATISIKNSTDRVFDFIEIPNTGEYVCSDFIPIKNETYYLTIIYNNNTYTATETLKPVAPITTVVQNNAGGFSGKDIEVKTFYNDPANETNYYLYKYVYSNQVKSNYYVDEDTFFNGNEFFSISQNSDLKKDDKIEISHFGISKQYYNYMSVLVSIAGNNGGGPFQSPPATVRGNIINTTNAVNYPLGYFSLSEFDVLYYSVE